MNETSQDREWERGWAGHELAQLRRMARLPLSEKLAWLEEAHRLAERLGSQSPTRAAPIPADSQDHERGQTTT
jgi:hypothetical protein